MTWFLLVALGCSAPPATEIPQSTTAGGKVTTARGTYTVEWTPSPAPVPLNGLFEVRSIVRDARTGAPVELGALVVDARMPSHGHGMVTKPVTDGDACTAATTAPNNASAAQPPAGSLSPSEGGEAEVTGVGPTMPAQPLPRCPHPGGVYVTRGMKFHMPGSWTLTFDVDGPSGAERAEAVLEL